MNRDANSRRRTIGLGVVASTLSMGILALAAAPAGAHVGITPSTTAAGAYAVIDVNVPHGCEGSPTKEVTIRIPEQINAVTPTRNALWEVKKQVVDLNPPVTDGHGNQVTERVTSVTYSTNTPLPDGYRDVFELSLQLPEKAGDKLVFPVLQTCEKGESAWIEVAAGGQDEADLALPAPTMVLTAAESDGHHGGAAETPAEAHSAQMKSSGTGRTGALSAGALALGALGALLGGTALVRQRRRS